MKKRMYNIKSDLMGHFHRCLLIAGIVIITSCTVKTPMDLDDAYPALSELSLPKALYLKSDIQYPVSIRVEDPQGVSNIQSVQFTIFAVNKTTIIATDTLWDNGQMGDIIPGDGLYYGLLTVDFADQAGQYPVEFIARDVDQNLSNALTGTLIVTDVEQNFPPTLTTPVYPDTIDDDSVEDVFIRVQVGDPQGLADVDSVYFQMYSPFSPVPVCTWPLSDDGLQGDLAAGDGQYGFWANLFYTLRITGNYMLRIVAIDKAGERGVLLEQFHVNRPNDPPAILDATIPSVVGLSAGHFTVSILAHDPQGLDDIKHVYFNSIKPDSTEADGNPFAMYDDGNMNSHGDEIAGDGWYSLEVQITRQNDPGAYQFEFAVEDQAGLISESQKYTIMVILD